MKPWGFPLVFSGGGVGFLALVFGGQIWLAHRENGSGIASVLVAAVVAATVWGILLAHELGHALVARRRGATVACIRFHGFGAATHLAGEKLSDSAYVRMVAAGPLVTALCYVVLIGIAHVDFGWNLHAATIGVFTNPASSTYPEQVMGFLLYMTALWLAGYLLPTLPNDAGRIVAITLLWWIDNDPLAVKLARAIGLTAAAATLLASAAHIRTLFGPMCFLAVYSVVAGAPEYRSLARAAQRLRQPPARSQRSEKDRQLGPAPQ